MYLAAWTRLWFSTPHLFFHVTSNLCRVLAIFQLLQQASQSSQNHLSKPSAAEHICSMKLVRNLQNKCTHLMRVLPHKVSDHHFHHE
jgi:hypothetical protein